MADSVSVKSSEELNKIYDDTSFYIDAITSEYGFYSSFIKAIEEGKTGLGVQRQILNKNIESAWVDAIEEVLPTLDQAIRNPSVGILEKEEVLPIEFSNHITQKSLQHLAQHTDYISRIEDGMVMPSKILNVYYDETKQTYENKFLNTLIDRLFIFVDRRYAVFKERGPQEINVKMNLDSDFNFSGSVGKIHFSLESSTPSGSAEQNDLFERVKKIYRILAQYKNSAFVKAMEGAMVTPPVMRTNALLKNKYLSQCLTLWDFIETYDKVGYTIESAEQSEQPSDTYVQQLYAMLSLQYLSFIYHLNTNFREGKHVLESHKTGLALRPEYIRNLEILQAEKFNIYDTEFRKVVNVFGGGSARRLSGSETKLRNAVALAVREDRRLESEWKRQRKAMKKLSGVKK